MFMEKEEAFGKEWIPLFVENTYKGKYFFSFIKIMSCVIKGYLFTFVYRFGYKVNI